jgi:hypothetical protein
MIAEASFDQCFVFNLAPTPLSNCLVQGRTETDVIETATLLGHLDDDMSGGVLIEGALAAAIGTAARMDFTDVLQMLTTMEKRSDELLYHTQRAPVNATVMAENNHYVRIVRRTPQLLHSRSSLRVKTMMMSGTLLCAFEQPRPSHKQVVQKDGCFTHKQVIKLVASTQETRVGALNTWFVA